MIAISSGCQPHQATIWGEFKVLKWDYRVDMMLGDVEVKRLFNASKFGDVLDVGSVFRMMRAWTDSVMERTNRIVMFESLGLGVLSWGFWLLSSS